MIISHSCGPRKWIENYFCFFEETFMQQHSYPSSIYVFLYGKKICELCREKLTWDYSVIYISHQLLQESEKIVFLKFAAGIPSYFWSSNTYTFCGLDAIIPRYLFWGKLNWYEKWPYIWDSADDKFSSYLN